MLAHSLLSGLLVSGLLALLVAAGGAINLRKVFINASPVLYHLLTFGMDREPGMLLLLLLGAMSGLLAGLFCLSPAMIRKVLLISFGSIVGAGVLQDLLRPTFSL